MVDNLAYFKSPQDLSAELRDLFVSYFFKFSRFEYALKNNNFVKKGWGNGAKPDWKKFRKKFSGEYIASNEARELLAAPPQRQIVRNQHCDWEDTDLTQIKSDLGRVILILKTIRNNLFHGGKSSQKDWDSPERNKFLVQNGIKVLGTLAALGGLGNDYWRSY